MPWGDGTGPWGLGPRTGRGFGYCAGYPHPGFVVPFPRGGRWFWWGRGFWGRGFGRGFWGRGRGFRRAFHWLPFHRYRYPMYYYPPWLW